MQRRCGRPTRTPGQPCHNQVRAGADGCHLHRGLAEEAPIPELAGLVEQEPAGAAARARWSRPLARRLAGRIGGPAVADVVARCRPGDCAELAVVARHLEGLTGDDVGQTVGSISYRAVLARLPGRPALAQVAAELARRTAGEGPDAPVRAAGAVRLLGVHLCAARGWLDRCACLGDLVGDAPTDPAVHHLQATLDP